MNCKLFLLYFWANVDLASIRDLTITTQKNTILFLKFEVEMQQLIRINVDTLQPIIIVVV